MSVRLCVCASVCLSLRKCAATFEPLDGSAQNFQVPLNSSQINFWAGDPDPGARGVRPGPRKSGFPPNRGFGAGGSCRTFSESGQRGKQHVGSGILSFGPRPEKTRPEGGAGRGADKNFGISTFFIKGTPAKIRRWSFSVLCNFLIRRTPRAPRVPRGPGGSREG